MKGGNKVDFNSLVNGLMSNEKGATFKNPVGGLGFGSSCIWIILFLIFCGFGYDMVEEVAAVVDVDVILQKKT